MTTAKPRRILGEDDLTQLAGGMSPHRISLYTPVDPAPPDRHANALRLRAGFEHVVRGLRERGVGEEEIAAHREAVASCEAEVLPSLTPPVSAIAWLGDAAGWWWAPMAHLRREDARVAEHFALRPLIRALRRDVRFRVLALSANRVDAYEGDEGGLHPVSVDGLPRSLEDALGSEVERRGLSFRSEHPVPGESTRSPIYHGHAGAKDERAIDRERFHRILARALEATWAKDPIPIVLAAEVRTAGEIRKQASVPCLLHEELRGNPERESPSALHRGAWPIVQGFLDSRDLALAEGYEAARGAGKALEGDFDAAIRAAWAGRVRRLWVEERARLPGRVDEATGRRVPSPHPEDDALDALVAEVLRRAGEVWVVEGGVPGTGAYCVELR